MSGTERRAHPRFETGSPVTATFVGASQSVSLINISMGGFAVASDQPLQLADRPEVRFAVPERDWSVVLSARTAYTLLEPRDSGPHMGKWVTGYAFLHTSVPGVQRQLRDLIDHVAAVLA